MPMAARLARKFRTTTTAAEDLEQAAYLALVKSVDRYSADSGPFERYAIPCILGELKRYFRDYGWGVHVPRSAQENFLRVRDETKAFASQEGRSPTAAELVELTGLELEQVVEALDVEHAYSPKPLDAPVGEGDEAGTLGETLGEQDARFDVIELSASVAPAFNRLPRRERQILKLRFVDDLTQSEIAARIGCSQMQISRLLRGSLERLRMEIDGESSPTIEREGTAAA
jgi:RNA polymerase sigma-B factor